MIKHLQGFLLRKTFLSNDDGLLTLITDGGGKITVKCTKLAKSRKRLPHCDFFRLLELVVEEKGSFYRLKEVETKMFWHQFVSDYQLNQSGFEWLDLLDQRLPEGQNSPILFEEILTTFVHATPRSRGHCEAFLRFKLLQIPHSLPRFDTVRGDTYFCPQELAFTNIPRPHLLKIDNLTRQLLEFIRRSHSHDFFAKVDQLPKENFSKILEILSSIETYHH